MFTIFDIETDGLLDEVTLIHCLSYIKCDYKDVIEYGTITDYNEMIDFLDEQTILVGHNIVKYDIPVIEKILEFKPDCRFIDTLGISYYKHDEVEFKHGLGAWGERLGIAKPEVDDWKDDTIETYINRCEEDVKINTKLFWHFYNYFISIYNTDSKYERACYYLTFKLDCLRDQEEEGLHFDKEVCLEAEERIKAIYEEKIEVLKTVLPRVVIKNKPAKIFSKEGKTTVHGAKWFARLIEEGLPLDTDVIEGPGNPGSPTQIKEMLFSKGWEPITFKKNKKDEEIPQISLPFGQGLCPSVKSLIEERPELESLDGLYRAKHRKGIFKSFLESEIEGKLYATAHGFTNTLRLKHSKPIANLPKPSVFFGKEIRSCLRQPFDDDWIMCGSDVSSLEDNTKQHYLYFYDPDYVNEMRVPGFDPHMDIGVLANLITKDDLEFLKNYKENKDGDWSEEDLLRVKNIGKNRGIAKGGNFSATYGAYPPTIAKAIKKPLEVAQVLFDTFWERNWAINAIAEDCETITKEGKIWLYNPVSKLWLSLRSDKDRFSTLNQSTGVYIFDCWLKKVRVELHKLGYKVALQYHDELLFVCRKSDREVVNNILHNCMEEVNNEVKLNVKIKVDADWGKNYAECH